MEFNSREVFKFNPFYTGNSIFHKSLGRSGQLLSQQWVWTRIWSGWSPFEVAPSQTHKSLQTRTISKTAFESKPQESHSHAACCGKWIRLCLSRNQIHICFGMAGFVLNQKQMSLMKGLQQETFMRHEQCLD